VARLRIGFVTQPFDDCGPGPHGSVGILTWEIVRRLARSHEILVCAPLNSGRMAGETCEGVRFARISLRRDLKLLALIKRAPVILKFDRPLISRGVFYGLYGTRVARTVRAFQCEIVHIHNFSQFVPLVRAFSPRAKIVLHMHSTWLSQFDSTLIDSRLKNVDAIIGCSEYVTDGIRKRFPHHAQRCVTVFNGVDTRSFVPAEPASWAFNANQIIYIGRISPEKGLHVLLKAFEHVAKHRPEATLQIVGGPYVAPLVFHGAVAGDPLIQKLGPFYAEPVYVERLRQQIRGALDGRVFINEELPHHELKKLLQNSAVLVQPSLGNLCTS